MTLKNVKGLEYNVIQMVNGLLEITTFNQKTRPLNLFHIKSKEDRFILLPVRI